MAQHAKEKLVWFMGISSLCSNHTLGVFMILVAFQVIDLIKSVFPNHLDQSGDIRVLLNSIASGSSP
jgi:hypothetical protein